MTPLSKSDLKVLLLIAVAIICFQSCAINNVQHQPYYKGQAKGIITDMFVNKTKGTTVVLDNYLFVNVWQEHLDSTFNIGNAKTLNIKWLTTNIKKNINH